MLKMMQEISLVHRYCRQIIFWRLSNVLSYFDRKSFSNNILVPCMYMYTVHAHLTPCTCTGWFISHSKNKWQYPSNYCRYRVTFLSRTCSLKRLMLCRMYLLVQIYFLIQNSITYRFKAHVHFVQIVKKNSSFLLNISTNLCHKLFRPYKDCGDNLQKFQRVWT